MKKLAIMTMAMLFLVSTMVSAKPKRLDYAGYLRSAKIYLTLTPKDYKKAAEMLEEAIKNYPDEPPVEAHFILGTIYSDKKLYKEMDEEFKYVSAMCDTSSAKSVKKLCKEEEIPNKISDIRIKEWISQYNDGVKTLQMARSQDSACKVITDSLEKSACDSNTMKVYNDATGFFKTSTMLLPDSAQGWVNLGLIYYSTGKTEEALEQYRKAYSLNKKDMPLLSNMSSIYFNTQRYDSAAYYFNQMLDLDISEQTRADVLYNMAFAMNAIDNLDSAIVLLTEVVKITPDSPDALYNLGAFLIKSGSSIIEKSNLYRDSLESNPGKYQPMIDSLDNRLKEIYTVAAGYFERVVELQPDNTDALDWLGRGYFVLEKWNESKAAYLKLVKIEPEDEDAWCQLLLIYLKQNEKAGITEAKKHCKRYQ